MGWFRLGFVLFFFWVQGSAAESRGVLFEIQNGAAAPCYLFGTIHSEDPRILALPARVQQSLDGSETFLMEVIPDTQALIRSMLAMVYTDGRTLKDALGPDLYRQTLAALSERGLTEPAIRDFKAWAALLLLSVPQSVTGEFLDIVLYKQARAEEKTIVSLESIEEQLAVFDDLMESDQIALLRETLREREQLPRFFERLVQLYLARDLPALLQVSDAYLRGGDPRLAALFKRVALDIRNQRMATRMEPYLREGSCFIAIGALHLPGPGGVLDRLRQRGFSLRSIY